MSQSANPSSRLPSPAIVAQEAVRRFPHWALLLLCAIYIAAGFIGREPWKSADIAGFGQLFDVMGTSDGAWLIARIGAAALIGLTLLTTWYSTYYLAKREAAQPVPFAFGGEAKPKLYARAIADGALLALLACLGLAQLSHETTFAIVQTALVSLLFFALSCYRFHPFQSAAALGVSLLGLGLTTGKTAFDFSLWSHLSAWRAAAHMLVWFAWPVWILTILTLIKWRKHWLRLRPATHIALPLGFVLLHLVLLPCAVQTDRWFLSALPALATLAAFALPTLRRGMKSLIDLFTLFFFSGCAFAIWIIWIAMQTGTPPQIAANVTRLAPAFMPTFSAPVFLLASAATVAWGVLVRWRLGKHQPAIWMSMVLPAGGAALCWMLLMSLWLPLLDHARSYKPLMMLIQKNVTSASPTTSPHCIQIHGLRPAQEAALRYYLDRPLVQANRGATCDWLLVDGDDLKNLPEYVEMQDWQLSKRLRRPTDNDEDWLIYRRKTNAQN
ncbi:MAG: hypothetical protein QM533_11080 [Cytophagales bacterium]|nr:hypothetical protein [Cytophagales bacterium]